MNRLFLVFHLTITLLINYYGQGYTPHPNENLFDAYLYTKSALSQTELEAQGADRMSAPNR